MIKRTQQINDKRNQSYFCRECWQKVVTSITFPFISISIIHLWYIVTWHHDWLAIRTIKLRKNKSKQQKRATIDLFNSTFGSACATFRRTPLNLGNIMSWQHGWLAISKINCCTKFRLMVNERAEAVSFSANFTSHNRAIRRILRQNHNSEIQHPFFYVTCMNVWFWL